jgi:glutamyl-tRNA reductase
MVRLALDDPKESFFLVGVSFHTLPINVREELARRVIGSDTAISLKNGSAISSSITGLAIIATCNRIEIFGTAISTDLEGVILKTKDHFFYNVKPSALYSFVHLKSVQHLFRVASSLDSMVVGEAQILGQVKSAYELSCRSLPLHSKYFHAAFQYAFRVAKRVRSGTGISKRGVSLPYVAVKLATTIVGKLSDATALILGGGRMAELVAQHLRSAGIQELIVANRSFPGALSLASRVRGVPLPLDDVYQRLGRAHIIIGALSVPEAILTEATFKVRPSSPLLLIDLGVPRNFSEELSEIPNVFLYNVDDLGKIAQENQELRMDEAKDGELMVALAILDFERLMSRYAKAPREVKLREEIYEICKYELEREIGLIEEESVDRLCYRIYKKIAHIL